MHAQFSDKKHKQPSNSASVSYYKLPYIGNLSTEIKQKIIQHCKYYCKNINTKIAFSPLFSVKVSVPKYLIFFIVYRFTCPGCNASCTSETTCHLITRIKEHLETNKKSHTFKHFNTTRNCKEAMHITSKKTLKKKVKDVIIFATV